MTTTDAHIGRTVLALDELLADDDLLAAALAEAHRTRTAHDDQADAAARDAEAFLDRLAPALGGTRSTARPGAIPAWIRLPLLTTFVRWTLGYADTCLHDPNPRRPQLVYSTAWRPDLVTCMTCAGLHLLRPGSDADRTCDRCGRITAGTDHDGIVPGAVTYGPLAFSWGACTDCRPSADAELEAAA
ncbi:hypothetical protein [Pseudonocardia parietis]|uniref:Uncharacterized protein n=1 Tax=Pseudonocardia parietis TaxID=570936 RepID=A0ABS4W3B3_9PSEU|nr:hypothetical protein [Pseudonocardia parietis]MBP2370692.1 hypothetical protein [Pseudonocardia parietis]